MDEILVVSNLSIRLEEGAHEIIRDVSFRMSKPGILAIVGESGSGKTTLCRSLTELFVEPKKVIARGSVLFEEFDLLRCDEKKLREIRQKRIRYVFQEPLQALNPVQTIRRQLELAAPLPRSQVELIADLERVGLTNAKEVLGLYPHELSMGMAQRVLIAMAIMPKPVLLIADEPTSALDATLRYQLLDLLKALQRENDMAILLVTHDLDIARRYADTIAVLRNGQIVEHAPTEKFFDSPEHEYSNLLIASMPKLAEHSVPSHLPESS
jgi:ABC-type dipeptide/oligopeptide/nickel transport system ATPase component